MLSNKEIANKFEKALGILFNNYNIRNIINHTKSFDCFLLDYLISIELKICYKFKKRQKRSLNQEFLKNSIGIKNKQVNKTDYYIIIILENNTYNLNYIKGFSFYIINKSQMINFIKKYHKNRLCEKFYITYNQLIKNFKNEQIITFIENLKKANI